MFKNFLSFFLVALVAVQASPSYTVDLSEEETFINISDILEKIIEEIEKILGNVTVEEIIEKIIEAIKNIIGNSAIYGNPKECVEAQKPRIKEIAEEAKAGAQACVDTAKAALAPIREKGEDLIQEASGLIKQAAFDVKECLKGSDKWKCIKDVRAKLAADMKEIRDQVMELKGQAEAIATEAKSCVNGVRQNIRDEVKKVLEDIRACIKAPAQFILY